MAAEVTNTAADSAQLPVILHAVKANLGADPEQALADAGYRSEAVFEQLSGASTELMVALGRECKEHEQIDAEPYPRAAAMYDKLLSPEGQRAYRKLK